MKRLIPSVVFGLALLLLPGLAWAQQGTVTGTVTEAETGNPLPGATVQIVDEGSGAASDAEGQYRIAGVPAGEQTLRVSFVGYQEQERTVNVPEGGTVRVNFQLQSGTAQLEAVTVSAYRPEADRTVEGGAAASISSEDVESAQVQSAEGAIQGKASGVRVLSTSGQPGAGFSVNVRGAVSVNAGTDPLYIVDGVQVNKEDNLAFAQGNPLSSLNSNDIESIRVLKDAASAAIYGAQAANGVVLIETKSGRAGDTRINVSSQVGFRDAITPFDPMTTEQFFNFQDEALNNAVAAKTPFRSLEDAGIPANTFIPGAEGALTARQYNRVALGPDTINTDWKDAILRTGNTQSYNASISGGSESTQFRVSGSFERTEAQAISSGFRQGQLRAKIENEAADYLSLTANANLSTNKYEGVTEAAVSVGSPFFASFQLRPNLPIYNTVGDPSSGFNFPGRTFPNPVASQELNTRESGVNSVSANVEGDWDLPRGFAARSFAGVQYEDVQEEFYGDPRIPANSGSGGTGSFDTQRDISVNVSQSFSYRNRFSDVHDVSALAGSELRRVKETFSDAEGEQFPNELFRTLSSAADPVDASAFSTQFRQLSFFGNGSYTYDDTYQIQGTLRFDGNSRFGQQNRYGTFWTAAGFWRISNESFLEDADFLSNLKLRASYGVTGNSDGIGNFQSLQQYGSGGAYDGSPLIRANNIGNAALTWEEKVSTNIGLDYGFFGGRIQGSVDVFRDDRESLLLNRDLPSSSGFGSILDNVGEIRVEGIDLSLSTTNIDDWNGITWTTDFNISFQEAEVTKLLPDDDLIQGGAYEVGEAPGQLNLTPYAGANPANGVPMYYDKNGNLTYDGGDPVDDRQVGNANPDFFGGLTNTVSLGGLSVSAFFQYDYGRRTYANDLFFTNINVPFTTNKSQQLLDRWKEPGDLSSVPKAYGTAFGQFLPFGTDLTTYANGLPEQQTFNSTRFVTNASYIRLKRVQVRYSFPGSILESLPQVRSLSAFVRGSNLITWTEYDGVEVESVGNVSSTVFPQARSITFGIDLGL
ncbi:SusC/RagA family TonB-linked outer membrane protein [Salinibacter ruber]|jgi:TonB-linked SusC/RagA family outer membrane protein|uniref:SusC/RagA family TonB-linked outer membrane protein n=1 Tax=Salinibacter ruber TaxID=146919 RepID=UPI000E575446|nr:SusC/RagA family TonB-linked outer membrane protein [Salinibacter ruber]